MEERWHVGTWMVPSYDPVLNLVIVGTSVTIPAPKFILGGNDKQHLYHNSTLAIDADTGKIVWYYQHIVDHWDLDHPFERLLVETAITPDPKEVAWINPKIKPGERRKVITGIPGKTGIVYTLDRRTGEHMVTSTFSDTVNWAKPQLNSKGQPVREPAKDHHVAGALVSAANGGATNWPPPAYSPDTGLLYVPTAETYAMYYLTETDPRGAMGLGGKDEVSVGTMGSYISAIDYKTGKTVWKHKFRTVGGGRGAPGLLTTAGKLLFGGDVSGNFVAFDPATGNPLWHTTIGQVSNAPETYLVEGRQHVLVAAGDTLYAFALYQ